jgi:aryl-alcohol dehydrogenase (NADP+)
MWCGSTPCSLATTCCFRQIERELLPLCAEGIGVIPYNPLAGGLLTGKHDRAAQPFADGRFALGNAGRLYQDRYWHDRELDTVDALRSVADAAGLSLTAMAVGWVLVNPAVRRRSSGPAVPSS